MTIKNLPLEFGTPVNLCWARAEDGFSDSVFFIVGQRQGMYIVNKTPSYKYNDLIVSPGEIREIQPPPTPTEEIYEYYLHLAFNTKDITTLSIGGFPNLYDAQAERDDILKNGRVQKGNSLGGIEIAYPPSTISYILIKRYPISLDSR